MAFPTTGVLDNFNRINADTLGANWTLLEDYGAGGDGDLNIINNQAGNDAGGGWNEMYFNPSTYGPDSETHLLIAVVPTVDGVVIQGRIQNIDAVGDWDSYNVYILTSATPDSWRIKRMDSGVGTQLGAGVDQNLAAGDSIGLEIIGGTIKAYHKTAGSWSEKISRADATYGNGGYLAFYGEDDTTFRYDDFSGGTVVAGQPMMLRGTTVPFLRQWHPRVA